MDKWDTKNYILYHTINRNIPKEWRHILKLKHPPEINCPNGKEKIKNKMKEIKTNKLSKVFYSSFLEKIIIDDNKVRLRWEEEVDREISDGVWQNLTKSTMLLTNCTKLRNFQYKLTHRILTTNVQRNQWDTTVPPECSFCKETMENYAHLFLKCKIVHQMWKALKKWLYHFCYVPLELDLYQLMFNKYKDSFAQMVNTIILITKQYIYACKCKNELPNFGQLAHKTNYYKNLEAISAKNAKKPKFHDKKWHMYQIV